MSTDAPLGEWQDDEEGAGATVGLTVDVGAVTGELLAETITGQVRAEIKKAVTPLVAEAVAHALTPERLDELRGHAIAAATAELSSAERGADGGGPAGAGTDDPPPLYYGSVDEFVREFIVPVFSRQVGERPSRRWAAEWWRYPEAIVRLEALWRSWEHLRLDPGTGMSVWLRDHADHHLQMLWDPEGPFAKSTDQARPGEPLPYAAPPDGLFPDVRVTPAVPLAPDDQTGAYREKLR